MLADRYPSQDASPQCGIRRRRRRNSVVAFLGLLLWAVPATAQDGPPDDACVSPDNKHALPIAERDALTGDWGCARTKWENSGLKFGASYTGEILGDPSGGVRRGAIYEDHFELTLDIVFEKLLRDPGLLSGTTFHARSFQIDGRGLSANDLGGNLLTASGFEAERASRLADLWIEKKLSEVVSVRLGQFGADDEFITSAVGNIFVNSTFGWPGFASADLPSGGPAYPLETPGLRIAITPGPLSLKAAVFNGDPAGPGPGTAQSRDPSGTAFRLGGSAFAIAEAAYTRDHGSSYTGTYKIGGWYNSDRFADQRFDSGGRSLADPLSTRIPEMHRGDYGVYAIVDLMPKAPKQGETAQGLGAFLRLAGSPSDRNLINFYADGGLSYTGLCAEKKDDVLGIGLAYAGISDTAAALDRDARRFGGTNRPIRDFEMALELTYQWKIFQAWTVQPDLQFIFHPGGHVPDPGDPAHILPIRDAVVTGIRTMIIF
jgi:porin